MNGGRFNRGSHRRALRQDSDRHFKAAARFQQSPEGLALLANIEAAEAAGPCSGMAAEMLNSRARSWWMMGACGCELCRLGHRRFLPPPVDVQRQTGETAEMPDDRQLLDEQSERGQQ